MPSWDAPVITKGDVSSKEKSEHEELLNRLWAHVYALRAEMLSVERLKAWPYDETEPRLSQEHLDKAVTARNRQVKHVRKHVKQYAETFGTAIAQGESEFNTEGLLRLAGWPNAEVCIPDRVVAQFNGHRLSVAHGRSELLQWVVLGTSGQGGRRAEHPTEAVKFCTAG